jgi:hypothetical protein
VVQDDRAVGRQAHVQLYGVDAQVEGVGEAGQGVLRTEAACPPVSVHLDG